QMFNHGTVTAMLFLLVGVIYDRAHHRDIAGFGGLASIMPVYTGVTGLAFFAAMGLPGLSAFISEALVLLGAWQSYPLLTVIGAGGGHGARRRRALAPAMGTIESLAYFHPELALAAAILAVIFVDLALTGRAGQRASEWPGNLALAGAGAALVLTRGLRPLDVRGAWLFNGMIVLDAFSV